MRPIFKRTLKSTFLWLFIPMILLFTTVTGTVSYFLAYQQLEQNAETSINDTLSQTKNYLNERLSALLTAMTALDNNSELAALERRADLPGFRMQPSDYVVLGTSMDKVYSEFYTMLDSIYFYYNDGAISYYRRDILRTEGIPKPTAYYNLPFTSPSRIYWQNLSRNGLVPEQGRTAGLYKWLQGKSGDRNGIILLQLNEEMFRSLLASPEISPNGYLLLAGADGITRFKGDSGKYALDDNSLGQALMNAPEAKGTFDLHTESGQTMTVVYDTVAINKWKIAAVYPKEELYSKIRYIKYISLSVISAVLFLSVVLSGIFANRITRPLSRLTRSVNAIQEGHLEVELLDHPNQEIRILNKGIHDMLRRIRELLSQVEYEQEQKRLTELSVLQSQIQPHFLYNTLYSIKSLCDMGENEDASRMLAALSTYYRISISKGTDIIPVSSEIEHIEQYLYIQHMRYGDTFRYELDVSPDVLPCPVVKLTLQPLIENAIYHGVKKMRRPGLIQVRGWTDGSLCYLQVKDNGYGMEPERLEELRRSLARGISDPESRIGYGVRNVHRRLQLHYGEQYGLHYDSTLGEGTTVTARFPYRPSLQEAEGGNP